MCQTWRRRRSEAEPPRTPCNVYETPNTQSQHLASRSLKTQNQKRQSWHSGTFNAGPRALDPLRTWHVACGVEPSEPWPLLLKRVSWAKVFVGPCCCQSLHGAVQVLTLTVLVDFWLLLQLRAQGPLVQQWSHRDSHRGSHRGQWDATVSSDIPVHMSWLPLTPIVAPPIRLLSNSRVRKKMLGRKGSVTVTLQVPKILKDKSHVKHETLALVRFWCSLFVKDYFVLICTCTAVHSILSLDFPGLQSLRHSHLPAQNYSPHDSPKEATVSSLDLYFSSFKLD